MYYDFIKRPNGSITIYALTGYTDHRTIDFYNILVYYKLKLMEVIMNKKIMRVILSRKGFDSGTGGWPSIILPELDNKMISFPIPDPDDNLKYSDIQALENGKSLYDIMKDLKRTPKLTLNKEKIDFTDETCCHFDPDIYDYSIERENGWRGILGQIDQAQTVLKNNNVEEGDLFIFFGLYRNAVIKEDGTVRYDSKEKDKHTMFGYLQIDKILHPKYDKVPEQFRNHPHIVKQEDFCNDTNTIYIAKDVCTFDKNIKGYGMFKYAEELDLTKKGMSKSRWDLPEIFRGLDITYHKDTAWKDGYFQSTYRFQEAVIQESEEVEKWAQNLVRKYSTNRIKK